MIENPYQPPTSMSQPAERTAALRTESAPQRAAALFHVRLILGILLVPAIYNIFRFSYPSPAISPIPVGMSNLFFAGNLLGLIASSSLVYFFGLSFFEAITRASHAIFSRQPTLPWWLDALYATFIRSAPYAVAGAILWGIWVFGFYQAKVDFMVLSVPVGILAHGLAAALYLPLIYRWYRIEIKGVRPL
jgi:hypothetical protein